jgi:hypothetical protein
MSTSLTSSDRSTSSGRPSDRPPGRGTLPTGQVAEASQGRAPQPLSMRSGKSARVLPERIAGRPTRPLRFALAYLCNGIGLRRHAVGEGPNKYAPRVVVVGVELTTEVALLV